MVRIHETGNYVKDWEDLCIDDKELELLIRRKVTLFKKNPQDTRLENHALRKHLRGKWAFSITGDIRIVYKWLSKNEVRFLTIGKHRHVYGKRRN